MAFSIGETLLGMPQDEIWCYDGLILAIEQLLRSWSQEGAPEGFFRPDFININKEYKTAAQGPIML